MRTHVILPALIGALCFGTAAAARGADDPALASRLSEHIRVLAADDFEGRRPGTEGERRTLAYLQAQYEALGLQPGGPDGQWTQEVTLSRFAPVSRSAQWTGPWGVVRTLSPNPDILVRALTSGVAEVQDVPVVFAGYGVVAPERGWDDYDGIDVRGKLVLVAVGEPAFQPLGENINTTYNTARYKEAEAFRRGAAGVLLIIPAGRADPMWVNRAAYQTISLNVMARDTGLGLSGQINRDEVADMMAAAGLDPESVFSAALSEFTAVELSGVRFSASVSETRTTRTTSNFIARLPGASRPDETVMLLAHWDHLGRARTSNAAGDDIFNGAWDNASGTGALVEMARTLSTGPAMDRSVVFLHTTAEESGMIGSQWYAEHPVYPLGTTAAAINVDMLPLTPRTRDVQVVGLGRSTVEDELAALASAQGRYLRGESEPGQGFYQRTDHFSFAEQGVPAISLKGGDDLVEGGKPAGEALQESLSNAYYHNLDDEWRADYVFDAALENFALYLGLVRRLAQSGHWPEWKSAAEFGQHRVGSRAARAGSAGPPAR